jgi:hypothetical protein
VWKIVDGKRTKDESGVKRYIQYIQMRNTIFNVVPLKAIIKKREKMSDSSRHDWHIIICNGQGGFTSQERYFNVCVCKSHSLYNQL